MNTFITFIIAIAALTAPASRAFASHLSDSILEGLVQPGAMSSTTVVENSVRAYSNTGNQTQGGSTGNASASVNVTNTVNGASDPETTIDVKVSPNSSGEPAVIEKKQTISAADGTVKVINSVSASAQGAGTVTAQAEIDRAGNAGLQEAGSGAKTAIAAEAVEKPEVQQSSLVVQWWRGFIGFFAKIFKLF